MNRLIDRPNYMELNTLFDWFFDIQDNKRPALTPICFQNNCESSTNLKSNTYFTSRGHKTTVDLLNHVKNGDFYLEEFRIKQTRYYVGKGIILRIKQNPDTKEESYQPLLIFCFDEKTNLDNTTGYKILLDRDEIEKEENKTLKPKLYKFIESYYSNNDIIFTKDVKSWCFNTRETLKFKTIKEQTHFLSTLVESVISESGLNNKNQEDLEEEFIEEEN